MRLFKHAKAVPCLMGLAVATGLCLQPAFALAPWHDSKTITDLAKDPARVVAGSHGHASDEVLRRIATRIGYDRLDIKRGLAGQEPITLQIGDTAVDLALSSGPNAIAHYEHHPLLYEIHVDGNNVLHYAAAYAEATPGKTHVFMTKKLYEKLPQPVLMQWLAEIVEGTKHPSRRVAQPLPDAVKPYLQVDIDVLQSAVDHALATMEKYRPEFEQLGYGLIRPLWYMGVSGVGGEEYKIRFFIARDRRRDQEVLIKLDEKSRHLAQIFGRPDMQPHPRLMSVYEGGILENGQEYAVLGYAKGEPLEDYLARGERPSLQDALSMMIEIAEGLYYLHRHGLAHLDLGTRNIHISKGRDLMILDPRLLEPEEYDEAGVIKDLEKHIPVDLAYLFEVGMELLGADRATMLWEIEHLGNSPPQVHREMLSAIIALTLRDHPDSKRADKPTSYALGKILIMLGVHALPR